MSTILWLPTGISTKNSNSTTRALNKNTDIANKCVKSLKGPFIVIQLTH